MIFESDDKSVVITLNRSIIHTIYNYYKGNTRVVKGKMTRLLIYLLMRYKKTEFTEHNNY